MKYKIQDINELSDSREILESKPHPFTYILIYIILALIACALTWSWFSEKEIVVKGSVIVRPNEDILKVSNLVTGKITEVKAENGQKVKEGDILYVLDSKVQIGDSVKQQEIVLKDLEDNLKQVNTNIERCTVKAPKDGTLDIQVELNVGDIIQGGAILANVLSDAEQYKIDVSIMDKDIANIKDGQEVKYNFPALPYREYGFLDGTITKISSDSKINSQSRMVFYTAEGLINKTKALSHKGEEAKIKNGMTCEVQIVVRKEKMLYYILEKLSLKD